jgi:uncharacterized protein
MKYLLVFLVVFLVAWRWRTAREAEHTQVTNKKAAAQALPVNIVECAHCGVHIPQAEAVAGHRGMYCTQNHRNAVES